MIYSSNSDVIHPRWIYLMNEGRRTTRWVFKIRFFIGLSLVVFSVLSAMGCTTRAIRPVSEPAKKAVVNPVNDQTIGESIPSKRPIIVQTGRYTTLQAVPTAAQRDLLQVIIKVSIPDEIKTLGDAIRFVLKRSGYQLMNPNRQHRKVASLFKKLLPTVHRQLGPMTLADALTVLTPSAFELIDDPVHRLISYRYIAPITTAHRKTGQVEGIGNTRMTQSILSTQSTQSTQSTRSARSTVTTH